MAGGPESQARDRSFHVAGGQTQHARRVAAGEDFSNPPFKRTHAEAVEKAKENGFGAPGGADPRKAQQARMVVPISSTFSRGSVSFKSFSQKIRHATKDGWELVDAVYEVFCRARAAQADGLILESATWLADRGFGKPVQVGQLLDGEGNPVAFTLWSPATNQPVGDVITLKDGKVVENEPQEVYEPPATAMEEPKSYEPQPRDGFAYGIARPWGPGEPEPKRGE